MNIQINTEKLKELKPCVGRFKNWLEHYSEFCGSFNEFLDLDKITYDDKIAAAYADDARLKQKNKNLEFLKSLLNNG